MPCHTPIEYQSVRLARLRGMFPGPVLLDRIIRGAQARLIHSMLSETVFGEQMDALASRPTEGISIFSVQRAINQGRMALRKKFAGFVLDALPGNCRVMLLRWDIEEIKAALRYLLAEGASLEKRFRFAPFARPGGRLWNPYMSAGDFVSALKQARYPLCQSLDAQLAEKDIVKAEFEMERYYFKHYLAGAGAYTGLLGDYFVSSLDFVNINNALLTRQARQGGQAPKNYFIDAHGYASLDDFDFIATAPLAEARALAENRLRVRINDNAKGSIAGLSGKLKRAVTARLGFKRMADPMGPWGFAEFMEVLDEMVSDLKMAIYLAGAGTPYARAKEFFAWTT